MAARPLVLVSGRDVLNKVGGHETYVRAHALAAAALGFEPHVFCVGPRPRIVDTEIGVVHSVSPSLPPFAQLLPLVGAVGRFLGGRPGVHGVHGFGIWAAAAGLASRRLNRAGTRAVPVASAYATREYEVGAPVRHGWRPYHGRVRGLGYRAKLAWIRGVDDHVEAWGYRACALVLVNYRSVEEILRRAYGPGLPLRRIPYASELSFDPEPTSSPPAPRLASEGPLILAISRQEPRKGVDVLLFALGEVARQGVPFRAALVGPGKLLERHRHLAGRLGIADRVDLPGRVEDVRPWLERADVFVLPSLAEGSGSVSVVEALRFGIPVVTSACDGMPEDLRDGSDALLVPPGDAGALARALRTLIDDPQLRTRLGAAARRAYDERFSPARFTEALGAVYSELGILDRLPTR